jgi:hypothetical protein
MGSRFRFYDVTESGGYFTNLTVPTTATIVAFQHGRVPYYDLLRGSSCQRRIITHYVVCC